MKYSNSQLEKAIEQKLNEGLCTMEIANQFFLSITKVDSFINKIKQKIELKNLRNANNSIAV